MESVKEEVHCVDRNQNGPEGEISWLAIEVRSCPRRLDHPVQLERHTLRRRRACEVVIDRRIQIL